MIEARAFIVSSIAAWWLCRATQTVAEHGRLMATVAIATGMTSVDARTAVASSAAAPAAPPSASAAAGPALSATAPAIAAPAAAPIATAVASQANASVTVPVGAASSTIA